MSLSRLCNKVGSRPQRIFCYCVFIVLQEGFFLSLICFFTVASFKCRHNVRGRRRFGDGLQNEVIKALGSGRLCCQKQGTYSQIQVHKQKWFWMRRKFNLISIYLLVLKCKQGWDHAFLEAVMRFRKGRELRHIKKNSASGAKSIVCVSKGRCTLFIVFNVVAGSMT